MMNRLGSPARQERRGKRLLGFDPTPNLEN